MHAASDPYLYREGIRCSLKLDTGDIRLADEQLPVLEIRVAQAPERQAVRHYPLTWAFLSPLRHLK